jgi:hypothetical protein
MKNIFSGIVQQWNSALEAGRMWTGVNAPHLFERERLIDAVEEHVLSHPAAPDLAALAAAFPPVRHADLPVLIGRTLVVMASRIRSGETADAREEMLDGGDPSITPAQSRALCGWVEKFLATGEAPHLLPGVTTRVGENGLSHVFSLAHIVESREAEDAVFALWKKDCAAALARVSPSARSLSPA